MSLPEHDAHLEAVFRAWTASPGLHEFSPAATDASIRAAEAALGFDLPASLAALYRFSDGLGAVGGNLAVDPIDPVHDDSIIRRSDQLRSWGWSIPEDSFAIGGNGAGEVFALWRPGDGDPTPVVMVPTAFDPPTVALVGTSLPAFLRWWSGYYLASAAAPEPALDALGLPAALRDPDPDAGWAPYVAWADPSLPALANRLHSQQNSDMPSITVRDVPADVRDELAARAARSGRSLQEHLRAELIDLARRPSVDDVMSRARARVAATGTRASAVRILEHLDADRT